jgi:hypothetical protein
MRHKQPPLAFPAEFQTMPLGLFSSRAPVPSGRRRLSFVIATVLSVAEETRPKHANIGLSAAKIQRMFYYFASGYETYLASFSTLMAN